MEGTKLPLLTYLLTIWGAWPVAVLGWGQGGTGPPNLAQAPKF